MREITITPDMVVGQPVDDEHCHCGSPMHGIDHCPCCGCEQHETVCASKCVCPNATDVESHWDICWEQ
jgi:hypothetical protein